MMKSIQQWISGVIAISFAISLGEKLIDGLPIKRIWNLTGGIILILIIVSPLLELRDKNWELSFSNITEQTKIIENDLRMESEEELSAVIEEELETYISDKAKILGLEGDIRVYVSDGEEGYLPVWVRLHMPFDQQLSEYISQQLGLGRERQQWQEE